MMFIDMLIEHDFSVVVVCIGLAASKKLYTVLKSRAADVAKAESARVRTSQGKVASASKRKLIVERGSRS